MWGKEEEEGLVAFSPFFSRLHFASWMPDFLLDLNGERGGRGRERNVWLIFLQSRFSGLRNDVYCQQRCLAVISSFSSDTAVFEGVDFDFGLRSRRWVHHSFVLPFSQTHFTSMVCWRSLAPSVSSISATVAILLLLLPRIGYWLNPLSTLPPPL